MTLVAAIPTVRERSAPQSGTQGADKANPEATLTAQPKTPKLRSTVDGGTSADGDAKCKVSLGRLRELQKQVARSRDLMQGKKVCSGPCPCPRLPPLPALAYNIDKYFIGDLSASTKRISHRFVKQQIIIFYG